MDITKATDKAELLFVDLLNAENILGPAKLLAETEQSISNSVTKLSNGDDKRICLVLDSPDVLFAITSVTAQQLNNLVLKLRSLVYSTVIACSADLPFLSAAATSGGKVSSPIEAETASFITQQAHAARCVMSVRELDTGAAKDISGVLRVTRGGDADDLDNDSKRQDLPEMEALYLVQRDGNVKVFQRGADS